MINLSEKYPKYGFEAHKGYGTKLHQEAIRSFGLSDIHRKNYHLIFLMSKIETGQSGEKLAVEFLKKQGFKIIETNFKCKVGEIDIVAREKILWFLWKLRLVVLSVWVAGRSG